VAGGGLGIPGLPLGMIAVGGILVFSGIENTSITAILSSLAKGAKPGKGPGELFATPGSTGPNTTVGDNTNQGQGATGSAIADDALKYVGHVYVWGGPANVNGGWDCSSFVSWVLGHDLGLALPGGSWASATGSGTEHGPNVASYTLWGGAYHIPQSQVQAGDLICYPPDTHIAIATSSTDGVSAESTANGTGTGPLSEGPGPWIARRVRAINTSTNLGPVPSGKLAGL
jgi:cell wall-associated NlpC family hydrolase